MSLKLLVNKDTNKVIFADAKKDFIDVLFSFLTLPLGTIARLVEKDSNVGPVTVGCLNSLYLGVKNLNEECLWKETSKEMLLQPKNSSEDYCSTLKININDTEPTKYFIASYGNNNCGCSRILSTSSNEKCSRCGIPFTRSISFKYFCNGFVNSGATFVITDDLIVLPDSVGYLSFGLLQSSEIISKSSIEEMTVTITKEKVLDLLKCALLSKSPLTDLFLGKKPSPHNSSGIFSCNVDNSSNIQFTLNLVIRKSDGKILFACGEEDFADLLLSFLTFPLGAVVRKLGGNSSLGSIDGLFKSIGDLDENKYLLSKEAKNRLVDPHLPSQFKLKKQILPVHEPRTIYRHRQHGNYNDNIIHNDFFLSHEYSSHCQCMDLVNPKSSIANHDGYVKGPRMYMVTDELVFALYSPISALFLLNKLDISLNDVKEKVVTIGVEECLSILKESLTSTSALTNSLGHLLTEVKREE